MKYRCTLVAAWIVIVAVSATANARAWTDSTGKYTLDAELVTFNDRTVVLKRADHEMVAIPLEKLSEADREYLQTKEAGDAARPQDENMQTWTLRDGTQLEGKIVEYAERDVTLQRRRGNIYVNDRNFDNLPAFYQKMLPQIVAQQENLQRADRQSLVSWLVRQRGEPRTLHLEGVIIETKNGDEYAVPFSMLSDDDLALLKPSWNDWQAAANKNDYRRQEDHAFLLRSLAAARQRDAQVNRQIAQMQLGLQAVEAGITSLWEVTLYPAAGRGSRPQWVVVPGRNSRQATQLALSRNPGFVAGPVRRVSN
jgi:hypothetical protein